MAASLSVTRPANKIQNLLLCDVCKETINEPKILPCSHSFCKACLENLTTQDEENVDGEEQKLDCPNCRSTVTLKPDENVTGLPDSKFVAKLLTAIGLNRKQEACACSHPRCKEKPSITICMECEMLFCQECYTSHEGFPSMQNHTVLAISEIINRDEQQEIGAKTLSCTYLKQQEAAKSKREAINAALLEGTKALETVNNNKATHEKTAKDIKAKYTAQKDEMTKTVTDSINKILDEKLQEVDRIYDPACRKLTVHAEMISNYIQKVEIFLQRSDDARESSKLTEFLWAQKDIDRDIQMLQDLTAFQVQVENPVPLEERLCFYTTFKGLTDKCLAEFMPGTSILRDQPKLVEHLLGFLNRKTPLKLCYSGLSGEQFHKQCDEKAGTVVLVRVAAGYIFGGYTDQTWQGSGWKSSNVSFLFSLRNPRNMEPFKCPIINGKNGNAIYCCAPYGPLFGEGKDLAIHSTSNSYSYYDRNSGNSSSNLGATYQPPFGYQYDTEQTQSLFAVRRNFTPTNVEVFY